MLLDIFYRHPYVFEVNRNKADAFLACSMTIFFQPKGDVGSDLDVAVDTLLMLITDKETFPDGQGVLKAFIEKYPDNSYIEVIQSSLDWITLTFQ